MSLFIEVGVVINRPLALHMFSNIPKISWLIRHANWKQTVTSLLMENTVLRQLILDEGEVKHLILDCEVNPSWTLDKSDRQSSRDQTNF